MAKTSFAPTLGAFFGAVVVEVARRAVGRDSPAGGVGVVVAGGAGFYVGEEDFACVGACWGGRMAGEAG